jgi:predicted HTH transcriptional regulator
LKNKIDLDEVELVLPISAPKAENETVSAPVNAPVNAPVKLSKTQLAIVKAILKNKHVTYEDLSSVVRAHRTTIMRNMATLKKKSVIRRVGGDKNGYWELLIDIKALNP